MTARDSRSMEVVELVKTREVSKDLEVPGMT